MTTGRINQIAIVIDRRHERRRQAAGRTRGVNASDRRIPAIQRQTEHKWPESTANTGQTGTIKAGNATSSTTPARDATKHATDGESDRGQRRPPGTQTTPRPTQSTQAKRPRDATKHATEMGEMQRQRGPETTLQLAVPRLIERAGTLRDQWSSDLTKNSPFENLTTQATRFGHT